MMKKAVYAGSFDPVTNGHLWIINEAIKLFDEVIIAVGKNYTKNYTFSSEERYYFLQQIAKDYPSVKVHYLTNMFLVDYAKSINAKYIVRGIRNSHDYEYERSMRHINSDLCAEISTVFLLPPRIYAEVSSSMVKGLIGSQGWENIVKKYVPTIVFESLYNRAE